MFTLPTDFDSARDTLSVQLSRASARPFGDMADVIGEHFTLGTAPIPAAVLIPLILRQEQPTVLFTKRNTQLNKHPGQICFPGGRIESNESIEAAAIRETTEEVGIPAPFITPVGRLANYLTITGYAVAPVVGLVQPGFTLALQAEEVENAFEIPLAFLLDDHHYQLLPLEQLLPISSKSLPDQHLLPNELRSGLHNGKPVTVPAIDWQGNVIWGATASILQMFCAALQPL